MKYSHFLIVNQVLQFPPSVLSKIASRQEERHNKNTSHPDRQTDTWASGLPPIHQTEMGTKELFSVTSREEIEKQTGRRLGGMEWKGGGKCKRLFTKDPSHPTFFRNV
jgi:hypothetical protein